MRVKEQLRSSGEQYQMQTGELRASNEELQAMNEELRAATEELETSREELQSINEELLTVKTGSRRRRSWRLTDQTCCGKRSRCVAREARSLCPASMAAL